MPIEPDFTFWTTRLEAVVLHNILDFTMLFWCFGAAFVQTVTIR